jgi:hypothetical protein
MKIVGAIRIAGALGVALVALSMMASINAYARTDTKSAFSGEAAEIVDSKGNMHIPADYQTKYEMLGTWAVAAEKAQGSKEMHVVYASPGTITAYRKDGQYPDGTILVKEVYKTETKPMTTGTVSSAGTLVGWFLMVKDGVGRFPQNKLWGEGWGWAWFDAKDPKQTTSTDYKKDCQACHVPVKDTDWIYTEGYPPLRK